MTEPKPHHRAKLTPEQVREIRRILADEPVSYATLAGRYGVSEPAISHITNFQTWRDLDRPQPVPGVPDAVSALDRDGRSESIRQVSN